MSGVMSLNASYYEALKRLTLELAGVNLGSDHAFLVETRLSALARREGFESLDALVNELFKTGHPKLAIQVVSALLERDTHFNKDSQSFSRLADEIFPALYAKRGGGHIRILSFGCAAGQEAYGIAGRYTHFEIQRGLPVQDLLEFFDPAPEPNSSDWVVKNSLKDSVRFEDVHLLSNLGTLPKFHAVLFRGALPHYSAPAQVRVMRGLSSLILPYGFLLLGSDETLQRMNFGFNRFSETTGLYQKREAIPENVAPLDEKPTKKSNGRTSFLKSSPSKRA